MTRSHPKVFDCFLFFNELEVLDIRLHELDDVVDHFVIVEATRTFTNRVKPLFFERNRSRFSSFHRKIIHVVVDDMPDASLDAWTLERHQRNAILRGLETCQPDDYVVISDVDEIPRPTSLAAFSGDIGGFTQALYYCSLNCQNTRGPDSNLIWSVIYRRAQLSLPEEARAMRFETSASGRMTIIPNAGWHFSYLGDAQRIQTKLDAFSHQELNIPQFKDASAISRRMEEAADLFDRPGYVWRFVDIDDSFPRYIRENQPLFSELIRPVTPKDRELARQDRAIVELETRASRLERENKDGEEEIARLRLEMRNRDEQIRGIPIEMARHTW